MSETKPIYQVSRAGPNTLAALRNADCAKPYHHPDYRPPTPVEVDALIRLSGWSQSDTTKLVGVHYNPKKGSSTIRKWRARADSGDYREIPYSAWRLLLLYADVVRVDEGLDAIGR